MSNTSSSCEGVEQVVQLSDYMAESIASWSGEITMTEARVEAIKNFMATY